MLKLPWYKSIKLWRHISEVWIMLFSFIIWALDRNENKVFAEYPSGPFTFKERPPGFHWIGDWVAPSINLHMVARTKVLMTPLKEEPQLFSPYVVCTDWDVSAAFSYLVKFVQISHLPWCFIFIYCVQWNSCVGCLYIVNLKKKSCKSLSVEEIVYWDYWNWLLS